MSGDDDWVKLPPLAKVQHKAWKARISGYEELIRLFSTETEEKSPLFNNYLGLMKKFVADPHFAAQEKALDLVLTFMDVAACAPKCAGDITPLLVTKGLSSTRAKTKDKSIQCLLLLVEIERQDVVFEELIKGLSNKNPKIVVGCLQTYREALNLFGHSVVQVKLLFKEFNRLLDDRDKDIRAETKNLVVEVFRWIGSVTKDLLKDLRPVVLNELSEMFASLPSEKPVRVRYLRSQRPKEVKSDFTEVSSDIAQTASANGFTEEYVDPDEFIEPVEVLTKITDEYYKKITDKQWKERRDALEMVENLTNVPLIVSGDFSDFVRSLLQVINKDTNVLLVAKAATVLSQLAKGLRGKFAPYSVQTIQSCFSKFKERKPAVVQSLRDAIDPASEAVSLDHIVEDVVSALNHKTPGVRAETALFLSRAFRRSSPSVLTKKLLKALVVPLCTTSSDTVPEVREASFAALGAAMYIISEKSIAPFLSDLDAIRVTKVKEYCEQIVNEIGVNKPKQFTSNAKNTIQDAKKSTVPRRGAPPVARPNTVASANTENNDDASSTTDSSNKPAAKTVVKKKTSSSSLTNKSAHPNPDKHKFVLPTEMILSDDQILQEAINFLSDDVVQKLSNSDRQERLQGLQEIQNKVSTIPSSDYPTQILCRSVLLKPGLKDTNVQVLKVRIECLSAILANSPSVSSNLAQLLVPDLMEKIGDTKVSDTVKICLTTLTEHTSLELIFNLVMTSLSETKNPKNQSEGLNWLTMGLKEFGISGLPLKDMMKALKSCLAATNQTVRQSTVSLIGVMNLFLGDMVRSLFADEKPAIITLLNNEFGKNEGQKPPAPIRSTVVSKMQSSNSVTVDGTDSADVADVASDEVDPESLLPRADISDKFSATLMNLLTSKSWKERSEGLENIKSILTTTTLVDASNNKLQEILTALGKACGDVNKNLVKMALSNLATFARIIPKADIGSYLKCVEPAIVLCMGDSKAQVRESAVSAIDAWHAKVPIIQMFENDMLSDPLKVENPFLRAELLRWLGGNLSTLPPYSLRRISSELGENFVPQVLACLEDRSPDARKQANSILTPLIQQLGWDVFSKAANRLKPTSKDNVLTVLEKARENVTPMQSKAVTKKADSPSKSIRGGSDPSKQESTTTKASDNTEDADSTTTTSTSTKSGQKSTLPKKKPGTKKSAASNKVTEEQSSVASLILQANKTARTGRINDEKKRKILKWDFDSPTRDHIQQLNNLFISAGTSSEFHALLFHTDFKQHIKAIDQLMRLLDSADGEQATIVNVDIILKWIVLRFFETNPVVLVRCLEYLTKLFAMMSDSETNLSEQECTAFLPYLVMKVGDSKDAVRQFIRNILKLIVNIYPPSRLFTFVSNGVKAKTNKTRQECIDEMGSLIERFGINVCQPTVSTALKLIAQQIGDRDNGVRSAALNSLVSAYAAIGEQLWKVVGDLPEKDRSMLEERIRRSGRQPCSAPTETAEPVIPTRTNRNRRDTIDSHRQVEVQDRNDYGQFKQSTNQPLSAAHAKAREMLNELGDMSPEKPPSLPHLIQLDAEINDLFQPIEVPTLKTQVRQPVLNALLRTSPDTVSAITMVVTTISSNDLMISCHALAEIDTVLRDERWYLLMNHVNQILMLMTMQLRQVTARYFGDPSVTQDQLQCFLRCHMATAGSLFNRPTLAREVTRETLRELVQVLLQIMLDERMTNLPDGENVIRAVNSLSGRIIEASNGTRILSALIRLLHECVSTGDFNNRFTQAIMKSIWRITRSLNSAFKNYSVDAILLDCHHFLKAFPSATWNTRKSDVPLRTIKTLLHVLCGLQGPSILELVETIPNKNDSELEAYLMKTLKTTSGLQTASTPNKASGPKSFVLSTATRDKLADIFRKVGSKTPDEGLNELYDFTQMYPDVNVYTYLSNTSEFFQTYIKQALSNIATERARQTRAGDVDASDNKHLRPQANGITIRPNRSFDFELNADGHLANPKILMHRLATLRRELGLGGISTTNVDDDDIPGNETNNMDTYHKTTGVARGNPNGVSNSGSKSPDENIQPEPESRRIMSSSELSDIKRRLELIKSGQKY